MALPPGTPAASLAPTPSKGLGPQPGWACPRFEGRLTGTWLSQDAWTGRWIRRGAGQVPWSRRAAAWPRGLLPLSVDPVHAPCRGGGLGGLDLGDEPPEWPDAGGRLAAPQDLGARAVPGGPAFP